MTSKELSDAFIHGYIKAAGLGGAPLPGAINPPTQAAPIPPAPITNSVPPHLPGQGNFVTNSAGSHYDAWSPAGQYAGRVPIQPPATNNIPKPAATNQGPSLWKTILDGFTPIAGQQ